MVNNDMGHFSCQASGPESECDPEVESQVEERCNLITDPHGLFSQCLQEMASTGVSFIIMKHFIQMFWNFKVNDNILTLYLLLTYNNL